MVEQAECVEGISSNLCHSPNDQKKNNALLILDLQKYKEPTVSSPLDFFSVQFAIDFCLRHLEYNLHFEKKKTSVKIILKSSPN